MADIVAGSINQFTSYALSIVSLMIIYYAIKFFLVPSEGSKEAETEWQERGEKLGAKVKDIFTAQKEKEVKKTKVKKLKPLKGILVKCINSAEEAITNLNAGTNEGAEKAKDNVKEFNSNIRIAWRELRNRRDQAEGEEKTVLEKLAASSHQIVLNIKEEKLQRSNAAAWLRSAKQITKKLETFKNLCGQMITKLDNLIKN